MLSIGTLGKDSPLILRLIETLSHCQETIPIDAAPRYGNLPEVGKAIKRSRIARDSFVVTTKINRERQERLGAVQSLKTDLMQLGLEYVDRFLIHSTTYPAYEDTWADMQEAVRLGLAKSVGVSAFSHAQVSALPIVQPDVVQVPPLVEYAGPYVLDDYRRRGIAVEGYSFIRKATDVNGASRAMEEIEEASGADSLTLLASWCAQVDMSIIVGTKRPDRLERFARLHIQRLDEGTFNAMSKALFS